MSSTIKIQSGDTLTLGEARVTFQRTLRIPDDGRRYPLPPGLGRFPIRRVADYASRVPADWVERGGVFLPMYQREAMWLRFSGPPRALKVGVGKVCAISGERWREGLSVDPQDYVVTGAQPWLDGIATGDGTIRQFVAMPLGMGYTVEGQVTGEERHGGVQLQAYAPKPGHVPPPRRGRDLCIAPMGCAAPAPCAPAAGSMGLAAGGQMKQKIYPDPYGVDAWDLTERARVFVHIVNSALWREITGEAPPSSPVTAKSYANAGLPWFDLYDEGASTVTPTATLKGVKSVKQVDEAKSTLPLQDDQPVDAGPIRRIRHALGGLLGVQDGEW